MSKTCTYYLSMQSPYAYLGHARLLAAAASHDVQIELRPADFGYGPRIKTSAIPTRSPHWQTPAAMTAIHS
jgi:2-hydroxychromene-2-carboxylate isomerase